jgi:hypothetical protein
MFMIRRDRTGRKVPALAAGQKLSDRHDPGSGDGSGREWAFNRGRGRRPDVKAAATRRWLIAWGPDNSCSHGLLR